MKIAALRFAPYALPFAAPFRSALETLQARRGWVLCVEDDQGAWGIGEAAPLEGFRMESHEAAGAALAHWSRSLPGREIDLEIAQEEGTSAAFGLGDVRRSCPAACHGLELALLDLAARRGGLPLAQALSPGAVAELRCNATLSAEPLQVVVQNALAFVAAGFETLKIKVGTEDSEADGERVRALREAVGGRVKLRLDANGSWNGAEALPLLERLAPLDIEYVEQPLPVAAMEATARLVAQSPIPVAADEGVVTLEDARAILRMKAAQILVLKPMALGGILTTLKVARLAAQEGVGVVVTTMLEGAYGRAGAAHAAAALASSPGVAPYAHGLATGALLREDLTGEFLVPEAGRIVLTQQPGLGLERPALLAES